MLQRKQVLGSLLTTLSHKAEKEKEEFPNSFLQRYKFRLARHATVISPPFSSLASIVHQQHA